MGRFSSALTSLYGRDSDAWESKAPAVNVLGLDAVGASVPEANEEQPQERNEEQLQQEEPLSDQEELRQEPAEELSAHAQDSEFKEGSGESHFVVVADQEEAGQLGEESAQSAEGTQQGLHVEAATQSEDEIINFALPEMFQPNPKGMYELRTQLGIVTKDDLRTEITGEETDLAATAEPVGDESDAVLDLVQQVLGITPEVRIDGDSDTTEKLGAIEDELKQVQEDELIQVQMDTTATDAKVELESESQQQNAAEETVADSQNIAAEQAAVETDEPSGIGEQVEKDASLFPPASGAAVMGAVATAAASGVFEPVMATWANVGDVTEDEQTPIKADHSPPLSNTFPGSEDQSTRNSEAGDPELSQDTPTPSDAIDSVSGNAAAVVADASLGTAGAAEFNFEVNENADAQNEFAESLESVASLPEEPSAQEPSQEELPQESPDASDPGELTLNTQSWSPALGALARLDDKVEPSDFERAMAERLLETEFGHHIQSMSDRITQAIQEPTVLFFLSLEPAEQQTDVVGGLAMYVCAQREAPTLLVDADTTQKLLSKRLGNIGDGLIEATDDTRPWYESVAATSCERLRYLRIGNAELDASNIDDLRGSVKYMMSDWKDSFGLVLIDGGAIDSKLVPIFAGLADATYLTVKLGSDEREELAWATEQLSGFGASVKGCITTGPTS